MEAGRNAGIKAIFFSKDGEIREKADFNISDHNQLEEILESYNA